ncbi:hypothetical protein Tco_1324812 [Tanacetum coccineum]
MGRRSTLYCQRAISTASIRRIVVTRVNTSSLIFEVTTVGLKPRFVLLTKSKQPRAINDPRIYQDYMLSLRERMELDLEARLIGETLVINRSLDHLNGDYIELNDLNEPFELRRNQGDDLMPTNEEGEVNDEDKKNEISHPYQKLMGFYKGVLNLGPDYIRDAKTEEWLTRGHISVHEMES